MKFGKKLNDMIEESQSEFADKVRHGELLSSRIEQGALKETNAPYQGGGRDLVVGFGPTCFKSTFPPLYLFK
jgi:hypothetical protein